MYNNQFSNNKKILTGSNKETESEKKQVNIETHCFITFYYSDNYPFPIKDVFNGELNLSESEKIDRKYHKREFYLSLEEAAKSLCGKTRTNNRKAAYVAKLNVGPSEAEERIRNKELGSIILEATNAYDYAVNEINPNHQIEIFKKEDFVKKIYYH